MKKLIFKIMTGSAFISIGATITAISIGVMHGFDKAQIVLLLAGIFYPLGLGLSLCLTLKKQIKFIDFYDKSDYHNYLSAEYKGSGLKPSTIKFWKRLGKELFRFFIYGSLFYFIWQFWLRK